jgi:ABC-type sugar transport system ATPase subunit
MDEPLSNLDALLRVQMRAELKKLQEELGVTTIYVTHDQIEALTMGDRIAIMHSGVLRQLAHPKEIYSNPSDKFVGMFIGTPPMNFINCTYNEKDGRGYLEGASFTIMIPKTLNEVLQKQNITELILGIRPDDITLSNKKIEDKTIEANVYLLEHMGSKIIIDFELENSLIKVETTEDKIDFKPGDKANLVFNKEKMHIFDKKTEKAIS